MKKTVFIKNITHFLQTSSRTKKHLILYLTDSLLFLLAIYIAFSIDSHSLFPLDILGKYLPSIIPLIPGKILLFSLLGMYKNVLKYSEFAFLYTAFKSVTLGQGGLIILNLIFRINFLPISVQIVDTLITLILIVTIRLIARWLLYGLSSPLRLKLPSQTNISVADSKQLLQPVIIYGAGQAGFQLSQALVLDNNFEIIAFVDDNSQLWKHTINGIQVYGPEKLEYLINKYQVQLLLLAIPSATPKRKQEIVAELKALDIEVKTVPTLAEIISGKVSIAQLREINIGDILGREEVLPDPKLLQVNITNKSVLVTGAGGSIGSELCRQIAQQQPRHLVLYELNEFALYNIEIELRETYPNLSFSACLGSVTDAQRLKQVITEYNIDTLYHAAAYKHVPLVEMNPAQGVINNIYGTLVATRTANECKVETFVLISTDKAVRPTSVMGTTKRVAELILQALSK
ncbi:MAG: SDR family NAD(P)-dependent oxidoreductase, partial [Sphaerospermopsis kisseleviana]